MSDLSWRDRAACAGMDTELWFAESAVAHRIAKSICAPCPVRDACLQDALETPQTFGIWGGRTKYQRTQLAKGTIPRQRKTHCIRDHEYTPENTRVNAANGQRVCLTCERDRNRAHRERKRPSGIGKANADKTHCKHGHEFSPENTGRTKDGKRFCRTCQRDRVRRFRQQQKAGAA